MFSCTVLYYQFCLIILHLYTFVLFFVLLFEFTCLKLVRYKLNNACLPKYQSIIQYSTKNGVNCRLLVWINLIRVYDRKQNTFSKIKYRLYGNSKPTSRQKQWIFYRISIPKERLPAWHSFNPFHHSSCNTHRKQAAVLHSGCINTQHPSRKYFASCDLVNYLFTTVVAETGDSKPLIKILPLETILEQLKPCRMLLMS
jgi:hypothetical protein